MTEPISCGEGRHDQARRQKLAACAPFAGINRARPPLWQRSLAWAMLVAAISLTLSCGGEPRLALPANPSPTPASAAQLAPIVASTPAAQPSTIGAVVWTSGTDPATNEPADVVTHYLTDAPRLIATTQATALPAGSQVEAAWTYNDTPLEPFTTRVSADEAAGGRWLSFHLSRDPNTPWPAGLYEIAVTLDGALMQESAVEVVDEE